MDSGRLAIGRVGWPGWGFAWGMAAVGALGAGLLSFVIWPLITGTWLIGSDAWSTTISAQYVADGGLGYVYSINHAYLSLPGFPILYAPIASIGWHLGLVIGSPYALPKPSMWLLTGPFFFVTGSAAVLGADYLAEALTIPASRRRLSAAAIAVLGVWPTCTLVGHPEDMLAMAMVCWSLGLAVKGKHYAAAFALGGSVLIQSWAVLLVPILVAASPAIRRLGVAVRSCLLPATLAVTLLAYDWKDASLSLLRQPQNNPSSPEPGTFVGQILPWRSLAAPISVHQLVGSDSRSLSLLVVAAAALWLLKHPGGLNLVAAASVALYSRVLFEIEYWPYYVMPAAVLMVLYAAKSTEARHRAWIVSLAGVVVLYLSSAGTYSNLRVNEWVALCVLLLSGVTTLVYASRSRSGAPGSPRAAPSLADRPKPIPAAAV